jgi:hypothetical protein
VKQYGAVSSVLDGIYARNISGDSVTVDATGDISSSTRAGIQAYSGSGTITVTYDDGTLSGAQDAIHLRTWGTQSVTIGSDGSVVGGAGYTGVYFEQANYNNLYNYGTIASADGIAGMAVQADRGLTLIDNYGTISGSIAATDLGATPSTTIRWRPVRDGQLGQPRHRRAPSPTGARCRRAATTTSTRRR